MSTSTADSLANGIARRYGLPPAAPSGLPESDWSEVIRTQLEHRSVRAFTADDISPDTMATVLAAAQSASTSSNLQPWSVVVVRDSVRRDRLATLAGNQDFIREAPVFCVWLVDFARAETLVAGRYDQLEGAEYLEAGLVGFIDVALAAQNALLAAESLGLGGVFVGGIRNHPEEVARELALPSRTFAAFGLALGRPDPERATSVKPRLSQSAVVHSEQYRPTTPEVLSAYEERMSEFYAGEGLQHSWIDRVVQRLGRGAGLKGRHTMAASLRVRGLPMR